MPDDPLGPDPELDRAKAAARKSIRGQRRTRYLLLILSVLLAVALLLAAGLAARNDQLFKLQTAEKQTLAEQIANACKKDDFAQTADGKHICAKATDIVQNPAPVAGPQGAKGEPGQDGVDGSPGAQGIQGVPGLNGKDGRDGADGTNGLNGVDGATGAQGEPGVQGLPGVNGTNGTNGKDGRGLIDVTCDSDGTWTFYYSDGTTSHPTGPCRAVSNTPSPTNSAQPSK